MGINRPIYHKELNNIFANMHRRNVEIIQRWYSFDNFYNDMINKYIAKKQIYPNRALSLDRIQYTGIYEPSNCRFIPLESQASNKSTNDVYYMYNQRWTASQICKAFNNVGISVDTFQARMSAGWDLQDALHVPIEYAYKRNDYKYRMKPVMDMDELKKRFNESQFMDITEDNELFNYDPRNIEDIDKELGRNDKKLK